MITPKSTQSEMNEFVNSILKAEWAAQDEARIYKEVKSLIKKHGRKKAQQIWRKRIAGLEAANKLWNAEIVSRWTMRKNKGKQLPGDPPFLPFKQ